MKAGGSSVVGIETQEAGSGNVVVMSKGVGSPGLAS